MELYAYHATPISNQDSIRKNGLLINQKPINQDTYDVENQLFFTFLSAEEAEDMVQCMLEDEDREEEIIVFKIPLSFFIPEKIGHDKNMIAENKKYLKNFTYSDNIPADVLLLATEEDFTKSININELCSNPNYKIIANKIITNWKKNMSIQQER